MTKQQLIDYVMDSPQNTNPAILGQMVDEVGGSGDVVLGPQLLYDSKSISIPSTEQIELSALDFEEKAWNSYIKAPNYYKITYRFNNIGDFLELPLDPNGGLNFYIGDSVSINSFYEYIIDSDYNCISLELIYQSDADELWSVIRFDIIPEDAQSFQIYIEYVPEGIYE